MKQKSVRSQVWDVLMIVAPTVILVGVAIWFTAKFINPAPPTKISIAAASKGSPYYQLAEKYRDYLKANGITLEIKETDGSFDNLRLLKEDSSDIQLGFVQGGISNASEAPHLRSLGRLSWEPLWIFYQGDQPYDRLTQLIGKRILVGPPGSGTNFLAVRLLEANGVTAANSTLITMQLPEYVDALDKGQADAGFLALGSEAKTIKRLFASPHAKLMNIAQAEAFTQVFPYLSRLELKQGMIDFGRNVPPVDTQLVTTSPALLARADLHPALVSLMAEAVLHVSKKPVIDASGRVPIFSRSGNFPTHADPEYVMADDARRIYTDGPSFLQRYLPFWLATLIDRTKLLLLPIIGLAMPLMRLAPMAYAWRVRSRVFYWYGELKKVEQHLDRDLQQLDASLHSDEIEKKLAEIDRIEASANNMPVPQGFAHILFDLREHIDVSRRRIAKILDRQKTTLAE